MNFVTQEEIIFKLIKKKLKIKRLELLNNNFITIFTQTNLIKPVTENLFLKEVLIKNFKSVKISTKYLKNFINNELFKLLGLTNLNIYISKTEVDKQNIFSLFELFYKKFNIFLGLLIFNHFLPLKNYKFLNNSNLCLKSYLYIFISKIITFNVFLNIQK